MLSKQSQPGITAVLCYLSPISNAAMGSLHYIVEVKDKWPDAKPQSDNF